MRLSRRGQSLLEYVTMIVIVAAACAAMFPYLQRAVNARLRMLERQVNAYE